MSVCEILCEGKKYFHLTFQLIEKKTKLELELQNLHSTVAKLQQKELDLQLKIKEQSILLHEQEPTNRSLTNCADVLIKMCRLAELSIDDLLDDPNTVSVSSL